MADWDFKNSDNVLGLFFVDDQCIACDACVNEAPDFFRMNDIHGHAFVHNQPTKDEEISLCESAMEICPVEAIGKKRETN
mgnify:FL=1|tara:strand:- start:3770 stop:4009 length:240 start_codon:yes stop_codon:yes gene_type:complete